MKFVVRSLALLIALGVALFLFREPLLRRMGAFLVLQHEDAPADAIVVLSGSLPDRVMHGVDLYRAGLAPVVVLTRETEWPGVSELRARGVEIPERHELNRDIALRLGVPEAALAQVEERAGSTIAEVEVLLPELRRRGIRSILLVTSKTHTRRAAAIFAALAGADLEVRVSPTPYDPFRAEDWWHRREMTRRVLTEYGKWLTFLVADRWRGLTREPSP